MGPPGHSLWKAFSSNNNLVLQPFLGGPPCQSLWKAFPNNNNRALELFLCGQPGQGLWKEFRSILGVSAFRTQASLIKGAADLFRWETRHHTKARLDAKFFMRFWTPTPRIPDEVSKKTFSTFDPLSIELSLESKVSMRFLTPTPRIPDEGSKKHFRL